MKITSEPPKNAFTLAEVVVIIAAVVVMTWLILAPRPRARQIVSRISCGNNLKEIGVAYRIWASDNGNLMPAEQSVALGGWADLLTNANQGAICWTNYVIMANDLGQSPKLVLCPQDERTNVAPSFDNTANKDNHQVIFNDTTLSYFVGVSANDTFPQSIQGGDRNLCPGARPELDYGYSPADGQGNDVAIPISGPVSWSRRMHNSQGSTTWSGNILFGDGSVQNLSTPVFNRAWLSNAPLTTKWPVGHIPASPSIRSVFP